VQAVDVLETPRLVLEPWDVRHRRSFQAICRDPEVMRFIGPGATWEQRQADEVFDRELRRWHEHGFGWRSAIDRVSAEWLGFIGLNHRTPGAVEMAPDEVEIGWWLVRSAWGRGLASEAAAQVGDEGFERVGLDRIIARLQPANVASARVAEKIGMVLDRETTGRHGEQVLIYALTRDDWLTKRLFDRCGQITGAATGESMFGSGPAIWVGKREVAHVEAVGLVDVRLTKAVIRERRSELAADPRVSHRARASDWLEVRVTTPDDVDFAAELVKQAVAANLPTAKPGSPPSGSELESRRRFH
jgi:RimJ/RimL family protein N-acetyltransferase